MADMAYFRPIHQDVLFLAEVPPLAQLPNEFSFAVNAQIYACIMVRLRRLCYNSIYVSSKAFYHDHQKIMLRALAAISHNMSFIVTYPLLYFSIHSSLQLTRRFFHTVTYETRFAMDRIAH